MLNDDWVRKQRFVESGEPSLRKAAARYNAARGLPERTGSSGRPNSGPAGQPPAINDVMREDAIFAAMRLNLSRRAAIRLADAAISSGKSFTDAADLLRAMLAERKLP